MPEPTESANPGHDTVYLIGNSGHPNFGDEFITRAWLRYLARVRPNSDVILETPQPGTSTFLFEGAHPRLKVSDSLFRAVWETKEMDTADGDAHIDRLVTDLGSPRFDLGLIAARRASVVHVIGGGYVNAIWPFHTRLLRAALRLREITGAKLAATGLGLVPARDAEELRGYLAEFDHASVRDAASAELSGAALAGGDAFLDLAAIAGFNERPPSSGQVEPGDIWVSLQADLAEPERTDTIVEQVRGYLTSPAAEGRTVRYLESLPGVDRIAFDRLADLIPEENFVSFVQLWGEGFPARPGQTWLTTRHHTHLFAAASGAEGVAFEVNDDYYRTKHASLIEAGTGWQVITTDAGPDAAVQPSLSPDFRILAARLKGEKQSEADKIYR